jgi:hypothetical protein
VIKLHPVKLRLGAFLVLVAALALAAGCGSGGSAEISVKTGSMPKAQFINRADTICESAKGKVGQEYGEFVKSHQGASKAEEEALIGEAVDQIIRPDFEQPIKAISELGAPKGDEKEVAAFLNALQARLDEFAEHPTEVTATPHPFLRASKLARSYGLEGCANSLG